MTPPGGYCICCTTADHVDHLSGVELAAHIWICIPCWEGLTPVQRGDFRLRAMELAASKEAAEGLADALRRDDEDEADFWKRR